MLLELVEGHMRKQRMSPTRFGIEAVGDPKFVFQLRDGREPRSRTVRRVTDYIDRSNSPDRAGRPGRALVPSRAGTSEG
jgi:hypothetical protein